MRREQAIADCLLAIEVELRTLGWWESQAPTAQALASSQPFCVDTLRFEQWLQWVFLPKMKQLLEQGAVPAGNSAITEMGEVAFAGQAQQTASLLDWLRKFDQQFKGD